MIMPILHEEVSAMGAVVVELAIPDLKARATMLLHLTSESDY